MVLLGFPLGHSRSPAIHNASFASQGLPYVYELRAVPPDELGQILRSLKDAGFAGANVTVPHKQAILDHVDSVSTTVEAVGAANTLVWKPESGILHADNTDVGGFTETVRGLPALSNPSIVLGTGGAARAVAYALARNPTCPSVVVAGRNPAKAANLVENLPARLQTKLRSAAISDLREFVAEASLVVNATTAGMKPNTDETPLPAGVRLSEGQVAYDLVYNPSETRFMREARSDGAAAMGGLEMLLLQAALSYRMWTGREMDLDTARAVLNP